MSPVALRASAVRRLPLRVDPYPGEAWEGYLNRVAARYRVSRLDLMPRVLPAPLHRRHWGVLDGGMAMTPKTAERFGAYFNLAADEVLAMQYATVLQDYDPIPDNHVPSFDPVCVRLADERSRWSWIAAGQPSLDMRAVSVRLRCTACQAEQPGFMALLWKFTWHPACLRHELILVPHNRRESVPAPERVLSFQRDLLRGMHDGRGREVHLALQSGVEFLTGRCREPATEIGRITYSTDTLPRAWRCATEGPDMADLHQHGIVSGMDAALDALLRYLPDAIAIRDRPAEWFPDLLPLHLYVPDLSDRMDAVSVTRGRLLIGRLIETVSWGRDWGDRLMRGAGRIQAGHLLELLADIESDGGIDEFWWAVARAAQRLRQEDVHYGRRVHYLGTRRHDPRRRGEVFDPRWRGEDLWRYWACAFTGADWPAIDDVDSATPDVATLLELPCDAPGLRAVRSPSTDRHCERSG